MKKFVLALLLFSATGLRAAETPLAASTIVIFNSKIPESAELANYYAKKRGVAHDHLVGLACSTDEEISREDYDRTIAKPLQDIFRARKWWRLVGPHDAHPSVESNSIHFVALIKGMPLKIRQAEKYPGDKSEPGPVSSRNEASVDSELAVLGRFVPQISGAVMNPYFKSYRAAAETNNPAFLLVCRLDAPSAATVRRMIDDALATEQNGLWGRAFIDGAHNENNGRDVGDQWLAAIVQQLRGVGIPTIYENTPAIFPAGYPISDCALYYGWYTDNVAGPFADPNFRFTPGAIAVHIHSFSAFTLRNPTAFWVGPLLTRGATASLGNVYEPYLQLTTQLDIFNDRLLHGFTFAESAYMGTQSVSWMSVMVGDPLYRPYASWLQLEAKKDPADAPWQMYHEFALKNSGKPPAEFRTLAREAASHAGNGAIIEDLGAREAQDGNWPAAASDFRQARSLYRGANDILRTTLEEADSFAKQDNTKRSLEMVRNLLTVISNGPTADLLRQLQQDYGGPAVSPSPTPKR